ncbi:MAG: 30S ribosomal protein S7 [Candidatus Levybacteria bacterium]|nr:30S ribosomal protein S7 [Candidatus Levybacteria bacterium]
MRHKKVVKRITPPDIIYSNRVVAKLINRIMKDGKKTVAEKQVYQAFAILGKKKEEDPVALFERAVATVGPKIEVKARRVGGASYQIPIEVRGDRRQALAIRWLITAATARPNKEYHAFSEKLAAEILDILEGKGDAIKKRDTMQRMADANKAFAHFRW